MRLPGFITKDIIAMAFDSIRSHKFRSTLTVLGIIIGVMTVICVAALLTGLRGSLVKIVEEYGANNIYAFHLTTGPRTTTDRAERLRKPLVVADAEAIKAQAPAIADVAVPRAFELLQLCNHTVGLLPAFLFRGDLGRDAVHALIHVVARGLDLGPLAIDRADEKGILTQWRLEV